MKENFKAELKDRLEKNANIWFRKKRTTKRTTQKIENHYLCSIK